MLIANNTIVSNQSGPDGCVSGGLRTTIANNLIVFNSSGVEGAIPPVLKNNCVFGNNSHDLSSFPTSPIGTHGNISVDPFLVSTNDYHLTVNSPCINAGSNVNVTNSTDLDGKPRIVGGTVDIGAYELQNPASVISYAWLQQYSLPTDGTADSVDTDNDQMNNWREWRAGTNPRDASSVLKMLAVSNSAPGLTVTWQSAIGVNYQVHRTDDLRSPLPHRVLQNNLVGQPGTTSFTDATATNGGPYFYRVGVQ
jgi:hypothetical protein